MKTLIVDDEPLARLELRRLLAGHSWIEIVGDAGNIDEAYAEIQNQSPDLIFLDVQIPGGTGFDLLERIDRVPSIIFTTAYDRYAVKAFEVNALDYLLKPVESERLAAALAKARGALATSTPTLEQIFVRDGPRCFFLPLREISLLAAEGNYVRLHWGKEQPLLARSLVALEEKLDPRRFFRVNRQQIINLNFVQSLTPGLGGTLLVQLRNGPEIWISRRQARVFQGKMGVL
jgi:two-component system LytT family response regulator